MKFHLVARLAVILLALMAAFTPVAHASTSLVTGPASKIEGPILMGINQPQDFNFKTKNWVLMERIKRVNEHRELLYTKYSPDEAVFGQILDGRPWWGTWGLGYYGPGANSIKGPAMHSPTFLNPYILVGIRTSWTVSGKDSESTLRGRKLFCEPRFLKFWPKAGRLQTTFDMSALNKEFASYGLTQGAMQFDLIAYNARDLGFASIYVPIQRCSNITHDQPPGMFDKPFVIPHFFHCGNSCGYPGGCNNLSPACRGLDDFKATKLPARLEVWLYRSPTATLRQVPDFTCFIDII